MRLYMVRHGEPKPKEKDPERNLTEQGRLDVITIGHFLEQSSLIIPEIWYSTKARARQTAEIIAQSLGTVALIEKEGLGPLDRVEPVRGEISNREEDLMLVGHLPFLSRLASIILGLPIDKAVFPFRAAEIIGLERDEEGKWHLLFSLYPRLLE